MRLPTLVALDLDGTLVDSRRDLADAANRLIAERGGTSLSRQQVIAMVGEGVQVLVERVMQAACGQPTAGAADVDRFRALYGENLLRHTRPYPGIVAMLDRLRGHARLAVLTNKPVEPARRILEGLGLLDCFEHVVGGDGPLRRKPDPAGLLWLAQRLGGGAALLVGDSIVDLQTARGAAMPFALAGWGFGAEHLDRAQLTPDDAVLDEPMQLAVRLGV